MELENFDYDGILTPEHIAKMKHVHFTPFAYMYSAKMCQCHELEVGWNLLTRIEDGQVILSLPFYPENDKVTGGTCHTSVKGETAMTIYMHRKGIRKLGLPYKCWAHSHVDMGVFASAKDNQTIGELTEKNNWYYRLIMNNKKEINLMLFYKNEKGLIDSEKCTFELSPWSWDKEIECYPNINSTGDIESNINNLKKDYNYDQFLTLLKKPSTIKNTNIISRYNSTYNNTINKHNYSNSEMTGYNSDDPTSESENFNKYYQGQGFDEDFVNFDEEEVVLDDEDLYNSNTRRKFFDFRKKGKK